VSREHYLPQMILTLAAAGSFTRSLHRRQQQCHEDADDGDHDEQLNKRKTGAKTAHDNPSKTQQQAGRDSAGVRRRSTAILINRTVYL
jgi:hypothetical protein